MEEVHHPLGEQKEICHLNLLNLPEVSLQKYDCSFSGPSFVGFCLFLVYALAGDVVYADIKTVRTSPLELPSPLQRSDSHHHGIVLDVGCAIILSFW
uniref:Uncharacterized protein n=1 Tax=Macaca mulatta TaxID=9544 RepID=A0A1D5QWS2_MACMU